MGHVPGEGFGAMVDTEDGLPGATDLEPDDADLDDEFEDDAADAASTMRTSSDEDVDADDETTTRPRATPKEATRPT